MDATFRPRVVAACIQIAVGVGQGASESLKTEHTRVLTQLDSAEGQNTRIVRANLRDEILKLKKEQGKNILIGGVDIPSQLIELGLVDEYRFVVLPILAGEGRRLLEGTSMEKLQLKLVESKIFKSGCVALHPPRLHQKYHDADAIQTRQADWHLRWVDTE